MSAQGRPPFPPFTRETAAVKARAAEDAWNSRDPERVSLAYTVDSAWRNRAEFFSGRPAIVEFLKRKWARELDYRPSAGGGKYLTWSLEPTTASAFRSRSDQRLSCTFLSNFCSGVGSWLGLLRWENRRWRFRRTRPGMR